MTSRPPRAWGSPIASGVIRCHPEDFEVSEQLGFELSGAGEHVFLHLQKRQLNSMDLMQRVAQLSGTSQRDIGMSGLKDRNAVTRQWFSVGMAGRPEPDWQALEGAGDVQVLAVGRHLRKLRRGVHRGNQFTRLLRELRGDRGALEQRLLKLRAEGVPNYFGEQRFGRDGSTLEQAMRWMHGGRRVSRNQRSLYFSALRAHVFNRLLAQRVESETWSEVLPGDVCMLHGTRSFFTCEEPTEEIQERAKRGDVHPGVPLWGLAPAGVDLEAAGTCKDTVEQCREVCDFLEASALDLAWRPARMMPDDFSWRFCDDDKLQLNFTLGAGSYATALLAELVQYKEGHRESGIGSEQG